MSRPAAAAPAAEPIIGEYGFRFCYWGTEPLLEVSSTAPFDDVREQAYMLIQTIGEVLATKIAEGCSGGDDAIMDTSTAYILRFAAEAAAAMVGSLQVKP